MNLPSRKGGSTLPVNELGHGVKRLPFACVIVERRRATNYAICSQAMKLLFYPKAKHPDEFQ